ncbi:MAG TPA: hypothetical protein VMM17_07350 [Gemmatimonadaceae bacterium]|nr:hypothetical protein [Gemmatimonadaceae bacterium]
MSKRTAAAALVAHGAEVVHPADADGMLNEVVRMRWRLAWLAHLRCGTGLQDTCGSVLAAPGRFGLLARWAVTPYTL